jgi:outer membrane protein OmpA-like peptidoglycan-associated protein
MAAADDAFGGPIMSGRDREYVPPSPNRDTARSLSGEALPAPLAAEMGARFGADFGDVRVCRDVAADREARDNGARAFARGNRIGFATGRYDPAGHAGRELIAHELAHVMQQRRGGATSDAEARADRAAAEAVGGRNVDTHALGGAPIGIQAQPADDKTHDAPRGAPAPDDKAGAAPAAGPGSSDVLDDFALDKDTLKPKHIAAIRELAAGVTGSVRIEVVGHTDTSGEEKHNLELGRKRADSVKKALEMALAPKQGGAAASVEWSVRSAGESEPLIPTGDNKQEPRNRRVEIRVYGGSVPASKPPASTPDADKPGPSNQPSGPGKDTPADKKLTTQPPPTQVTIDDLKKGAAKGQTDGKADVPDVQGAGKSPDKDKVTTPPTEAGKKGGKGEEKPGIEKNLGLAYELEKSKEGTESALKLSFELTFPVTSWHLGPVKIFNEFSLEPTLGVKSVKPWITPLALEGALKTISMEWEKQNKAGAFKYGWGVGPKLSGEYTPQGKEGKYDVGGEGGIEFEYRRRKESPWFIKAEGKGAFKWGATGDAKIEWQGFSFSTEFKIGYTF